MDVKVKLMYEEAKALAKEFEITEKKELQEFIEKKVKELKKELSDKERDERAESRSHELKQKELDNELKQKELDNELKQKELELELKQKEIQLKLDHELELAKLQQNKVEHSTNSSNKHGVRFKMPPFDGKEKILDFLTLFETTCKGYNIPQSEWYIHLIPQLKDKGREALAHIDKEITDYTIIREQLIKFFIHSEDYYRQKFHSFLLTDKIEPRAFVSEVKSFLLTWLELIKIDTKNPNEIIEMVVVDKVLQMASKPLFTHIMERKVRNIENLIDAISNFKDSNPNVELTKQTQTVNTMQNRRHRSYSPPRTNSQYGRRQNYGNETNTNRQNLRCQFCNRYGHIDRFCGFRIKYVSNRYRQNENSQNNQNFQNKNFTRQNFPQGNQNQNFTRRNFPQGNQNQNFTRLNFPQGNSTNQHVTNPNSENQNFQNRNKGNTNNPTTHRNNVIFENKGQLILFPAYVEGIRTYCLRDTGSSLTCVDERIIPPHKAKNILRIETIKLGNGSMVSCPITTIQIDTPWLTGITEAAILKNCVAPLIIGNTYGVKQDNSFEIFQQWMDLKSTDLNLKPVILLENNQLGDLSQDEFGPALQTVSFLQTLGKSDSSIINDTPNIDIPINKVKENLMPKWNGTEKLNQYIERFEEQCEINNIPKQLHAISLCKHLENHKAIYNIAEKEINDFQTLKTNILAYIDTTQKKTETQMKKREQISLNSMPFDEQTLKNEQKQDEYINKIVSQLGKENFKQGQMKLINGILCRIETKTNITQIVVPKSLTVQIMKISHDNALAGHLSTKKTCNKIKNNFWWPNLEKDLKTFIKSCSTCLIHNQKNSKHKAPLQKTDTVDKPFVKIAIDIIGPMKEARNSKAKFALTLIDMGSRWVEVIPLREITADRVCNSLLPIFCRFGFPKTILSDNGTQFKSKLTQAFTKMLNITQIFSSIYHPESNGMVERANQTIKQMLAKVCEEHPYEWDEFLPAILFAYRQAKHESTGYSPFELIFGRNANGPLENFKAELLKTKETKMSPFDLINKTEKHMQTAYQFAVEKNQEIKEKTILRENMNKNLRKLEIGNKVLVYLPIGSGNTMQWKGPYDIIHKLSDVTYKIDINGSEKIVHINNLRHYEESNIVDTTSKTNDKIENNNVIIVEDENIKDIPSNVNYLCGMTANTTNELEQINLDHIQSVETKNKIVKILNKFKDTITETPGLTNVIEHRIELTDKKEFRSKAYRIPQMLVDKVDKELDQLIENKIINKSMSQYSSPMVIVRKKNGSIRLCCDYRKLNKITKIDQEGLPNIDNIINTMATGKIFSTIDLTRGFWQVPLDKNSKDYAAFITHRGVFNWNVMPFGLINSTATFTKLMRKILPQRNNIIHYVDDVCIYTETWDEHLTILEEVLQILKDNNLTVSPTKLKIGQTEIEFLGHTFSNGQVKPTEQLHKKILEIKTPKTKKEVRALLGLFNYYSKFIPKYSQIVRPIIDLTKKFQPNYVNWNNECEQSFRQLVNEFSKEPILETIQKNDEIILACDASKIGLGACIFKKVMIDSEMVYKPAFYISRALTNSEKNFSILELEGLCIAYAVLKFQYYLLGRKFTILTDHKPLVNFNVSNVNNKRINKYALLLSDYQFQIKSIVGKDNHLPDVLSRLSIYIPDIE